MLRGWAAWALVLSAVSPAAMARPAEGALAQPGAGAAVVRWRSQRFAPEAAPAALPEATRGTLEALAPLADAQGYRLDVTRCGRVVCVTDAEVSSVHGAETALHAALGALDEAFPNAGPGRVVVLARTRDARDAELFRALAADERCWTVPTLDGAPFRVAAWPATLAAAERRAAEGRLAAELTRLYLADRYGDLPEWFTRGAALHVEEEATGRFATLDVDATARTWRAALKRAFGAEGAPRIDLAALGARPATPAGVTDTRTCPAQESWALVAALASRAGDAGLGPLANDLARQNSSVDGGTEAALARAQVALLEAHQGPGVLARVEASLAAGRARPEGDPRKK